MHGAPVTNGKDVINNEISLPVAYFFSPPTYYKGVHSVIDLSPYKLRGYIKIQSLGSTINFYGNFSLEMDDRSTKPFQYSQKVNIRIQMTRPLGVMP